MGGILSKFCLSKRIRNPEWTLLGARMLRNPDFRSRTVSVETYNSFFPLNLHSKYIIGTIHPYQMPMNARLTSS